MGKPAGLVAAEEQPLVVLLGVADDQRSRFAAALLAYRAGGRVEAVSMSPAGVPHDPVMLRVMATSASTCGSARCWCRPCCWGRRRWWW